VQTNFYTTNGGTKLPIFLGKISAKIQGKTVFQRGTKKKKTKKKHPQRKGRGKKPTCEKRDERVQCRIKSVKGRIERRKSEKTLWIATIRGKERKEEKQKHVELTGKAAFRRKEGEKQAKASSSFHTMKEGNPAT